MLAPLKATKLPENVFVIMCLSLVEGQRKDRLEKAEGKLRQTKAYNIVNGQKIDQLTPLTRP
ncbi:MAG: hypothetical protein ACI8VC_000969 [Candidatus Endobugula sp.]|jgi:hypothetical protein